MRTTVKLDEDVVAAVEELRRERGVGISEALNHLVRRGLVAREERGTYEPWARDLGAKIDVANIGEVLDLLDEG